LVVGGGPAGIVSAVTARKHYPSKNIAVMKHIERGVISCGIPYLTSAPTVYPIVLAAQDAADKIQGYNRSNTSKTNHSHRPEESLSYAIE
jgi:hypothetical protein